MLARLGYKNRVAGVFIGAVFMQIMDSTIINVALPTLANEFDVDATAMDWTVLSFTLALAIMTASAGWMGDRFGLKPVFVGTLVGFVVASVLCGGAQSLGQLVAARALQGAFAGLIMPIGSSLLYTVFPIHERALASRKVVTVAVIAPALGPIVGGAILEYFSWRWIFFVNVPIGGVAAVLAVLWLRRDESDAAEAGPFDVRGFVLAAAGIGLLLYGLSRGGERGWDSPAIALSLVVSSGLLVLLTVVELRQRRPLLALRLLRNRMFAVSHLVALPVYAAFLALIYLLPLFLQNEAGHSPLAVGLALFPQPLGVLIATQITGRFLYERFGPRRLLIAGSAGAFVASAVTATIDVDTSLAVVRGLMLARGLSMGLIFVPLQAAVYADLDNRELPRATAIFGTARMVAPAIGVAIGSTVLASGFGDAPSAAVRADSYSTAMFVSALLFLLAIGAALFMRDEDAAATRGARAASDRSARR